MMPQNREAAGCILRATGPGCGCTGNPHQTGRSIDLVDTKPNIIDFRRRGISDSLLASFRCIPPLRIVFP